MHPRPLHKAQNQLPHSLLCQDVIGPRHIFDLFFSGPILKLMTRNTNKYAKYKRENAPATEVLGGRAWKPVTAGELSCWFGILIYMGLVKELALGDYWRGEHDPLWPRHDFCDYMSQTRFEEIKRYFHIADINTPKISPCGRRLWHNKVDPLLDQLRHASQTYRIPESNVTIDEAMMRFVGRSVDICKMPGKPIEVGYKFHCLADHGYIWDFWPHSGTKDGYDSLPPDATQPSVGGLTPTGAMCLHLAKQLPYTSHAFNIFTDNYYTTLDLLSNLRAVGIGGCGTTRRDRTGYPEELKIPANAETKVEYHFTSGAVNRERGVGTLLWFDNAPVSIMTTIHILAGRRGIVDIIRTKPTRSNPTAAREHFGATPQLVLPIPTCVVDYNKNKVGVDVADQYWCYYSTQLITFRNWFPIFFWVLDTAIINSFLIYRDLSVQHYRGLKHKDFRMQIAWELIMKGTRQQKPTDTLKSQKPRQRVYQAATIVPEPSTCVQHLPVCVPVEERRVCLLCRERERESGGLYDSTHLPKTRWKCQGCEQPLCLSYSRNCFYDYHSTL